MTGKVLALAAFAGAAFFLFATDKGKEIREELEDAADDWSDKLSELVEKATCSAKDLKKLVSKEITGLSDEARERISAIVDESIKSSKKFKQAVDTSLN